VLELLGFGFAAWEAKFVGFLHPPTPVPISCDGEWQHALSLQDLWSRLSHARCIEPMGLRKLTRGAVILGEPA
jgi:hypothetical protein